MCMTFSFPVTFIFDLYTSNIVVTHVQRDVSTKLEVSNTSLLRENRRHSTDGRTDGQGATLNAAPSGEP